MLDMASFRSWGGATMSSSEDILIQQRRHLDLLQAESKKPILIKVFEGEKPDGEDTTLYAWNYYKDVWARVTHPIYTRAILRNELLIDADVKDWTVLRTELQKIKDYCEVNKIPLKVAFSGGSGMHGHIFFDSFGIDPDNAKEIEKYDLDIFKIVRKVLIDIILTEAGTDAITLKLDSKKINFDKNHMGSMVREYGTLRPNGNYKTLIQAIPETKPQPGSLLLIFPAKIELWDPEKYNKQINDRIQQEIKKAVESENFNLNAVDLQGYTLDTFPCMKSLFKKGGMDGQRYYGSNSICLLSKRCGYSWEKIKELILKYLKFCGGLTEAEITLRVNNNKQLFDSSDYHFSCRTLKEVFGSGVCNFSNCVLCKKIDNSNGNPAERRPYFTSNGHFSPKKLADEILSEFHIFSMADNPKEMYVYINGVYVLYAKNIISQAAQTKLGTSSTSRFIEETINYIQIKKLIDRNIINTDTSRINVKNGLYNRFTHTLEPHTPEFLNTTQIPADYNPKAECVNIARFLCQTLRKEDIALVLQVFGYNLILDYSIQKAVMLHAPGGNGKGTLMRLLTAFLGKENIANETLQNLNLDKFACANLYGKLANVFADISDSAIYEDSMFKSLTGGDRIPAERKFENRFYFTNLARLIFSANVIPRHPKSGYAYHRRWVLIDFPCTFEGQNEDKELDSKLQTPEELSGLLNLALWGLDWLMESKSYCYSKTPEQVGEEYLLNSDSVEAFLRACTTPDDENIPKKVLYDAYVEWTKIRNVKKIVASNMFGKSLKLKGYTEVKPYEDGKRQTPHIEGLVLDMDKLTKSQGSGQNSTSNPDQTQNQQAYTHWFTKDVENSQGSQGSLYNFFAQLINYIRYTSSQQLLLIENNPDYPDQTKKEPQEPKTTGLKKIVRAGQSNPDQTLTKTCPTLTIKINDNCGICGKPLNGNGENAGQGLGRIHPVCKFTPISLKILEEIPNFICINNRQYGVLIPGQVIEIPATNAYALIGRKAAVRASS
jgi:P4 family phage/plasmid primase-like protien